MATFSEFSPPFSSRLAVTLAATTCIELRLVRERGSRVTRSGARRHFIGSFREDSEAVIGGCFHRITAARNLFIAVGV